MVTEGVWVKPSLLLTAWNKYFSCMTALSVCNRCFCSTDLSDRVFRCVCWVLERIAEEANFGWNGVLSSVTAGVETEAVRSTRTHFPPHQVDMFRERWRRHSDILSPHAIWLTKAGLLLPWLKSVFDKNDLNAGKPEYSWEQNVHGHRPGTPVKLYSPWSLPSASTSLDSCLSLGALAHITSG